jgi:hypothetical protein
MTRAAIFDWRGTLATTLTEREWMREALGFVGRSADPADVEYVLAAIAAANGEEDRLDGPGVARRSRCR